MSWAVMRGLFTDSGVRRDGEEVMPSVRAVLAARIPAGSASHTGFRAS
jgi:hypothetical protein